MPLRTAPGAAPTPCSCPSDPAAYDAASDEVWHVVRELPVVTEVLGLGRGGSSGAARRPRALAHQVRARVLERTGLHCCVGIGDNKLRAKIATGFAKAPKGSLPADAPGVFRLTKENWLELMGDRPTDALWGIGARTSEKLTELGISTVRELGAADLGAMRARFGPKTGPWLVSLGRGLGDRTVTNAPWVPRGRSRETTYEHDVVERFDLEDKLRQLAADVVADVSPSGRTVTHVGIKVRFVPFFTTTRVHKLSEPTTDTATVAAAAVALVERLELGRPIRLLGVRVELTDP